MVGVGEGKAAGEAVAVDVAALDEQVGIVIDRAVGIENAGRMIIRRAIPEHDIFHLRPRHEMRRRMHRQRAAVRDVDHRGDVILALGDAQHAVRRGRDSPHEARRIVRLPCQPREVREIRVPYSDCAGGVASGGKTSRKRKCRRPREPIVDPSRFHGSDLSRFLWF